MTLPRGFAVAEYMQRVRAMPVSFCAASVRAHELYGISAKNGGEPSPVGEGALERGWETRLTLVPTYARGPLRLCPAVPGLSQLVERAVLAGHGGLDGLGERPVADEETELDIAVFGAEGEVGAGEQQDFVVDDDELRVAYDTLP